MYIRARSFIQWNSLIRVKFSLVPFPYSIIDVDVYCYMFAAVDSGLLNFSIAEYTSCCSVISEYEGSTLVYNIDCDVLVLSFLFALVVD